MTISSTSGISRVDGWAKVTGRARYAAELGDTANLLHGHVVSSTIARGKITRMEIGKALATDGVVEVYTHENRPDTAWRNKKYADDDAPPGDHFRPLGDAVIHFAGQPVALVIAESVEAARYAASLIRVHYEEAAHAVDLKDHQGEARDVKKGKDGWEPPPKPRGDSAAALAASAKRIEATYDQLAEHHNPMEMHASTIIYDEGDTLTVYDKTQGVINSKQYVCNVFGLSAKKVRVISPFVGGAFGSGLRPQYQLFLAVMASLGLKRSVRVMLTRQQMFTFGHRPMALQTLRMGTDAAGKLQALEHEAITETSRFEEYVEVVVNWSGVMYHCENVTLANKVTELDVYTPLDMRAPGAATGVWALESAMDEMAYAAGVDPLEFRLKNYAEKDLNSDLPFSSKELRKAYAEGAKRFGWEKRPLAPGTMRDENEPHVRIGWGMATGAWEAQQQQASAKAVLGTDGQLKISSATSDIGTGTYTVMAKIASETLGLPIEDITAELGDTDMPEAPLQGGSWTAGSVGSAVKAACEMVGKKLLKLAGEREGAPFETAKFEDVRFENGEVRVGDKGVAIRTLQRECGDVITAEATVKPERHQEKFTRLTHSAVFVEVRVDEQLGTVRVSRAVAAVAGGRILNPKTARSQVLGGVVWGIGMALLEGTELDKKRGTFITRDLSEYLVAVNADIPEIDVIFVDEKDDVVNPLGAKGLGEIGIVGVAGAIANAIFHATGKRIRSLPITLEKLL